MRERNQHDHSRHLLAGYMEDPFWYQLAEDDASHAIEEAAEQLQLPDDLVAALRAWDDEYQATLNHAYPPDSAFATPEDHRAWIDKGKELAARIARESPIVASVDYQADDYYREGTRVFQ